MKLKLVLSLALTCLLLAAFASFSGATRSSPAARASQSTAVTDPLTGTNLLLNGDMDQLGFYPRPTNHYVARKWFEWWGDYTTIPEFIDGGINHHNVCYPMPASGRCHDEENDIYNSSQGYIRWGRPTYIAGIYQPVHDVTPCRPYLFEIYNRNDASDYHPKVGIDPTGWEITNLGNSPPENCPPDGESPCPDPYIAAFPHTMIWSEEADHAAFTWEPISVTAEAVSTTISVWTYAAPGWDSGPAYSTYWDYGWLLPAPFPDDRLPRPQSWTPSDFIYGVSSSLSGDTLYLTWYTREPASGQVWYNLYDTTPLTPSTPMSYTIYLPMAVSGSTIPADYATEPNLSFTTRHTATISLPEHQGVMYVLLSRRLLDEACVTEADGPYYLEHTP